ncbi:MAG TPA: carbamoyl-phosphate synthase domain-containing protein, partial [Chloroflexota bacterium]|nr:carbamoyl-phosphate synthase domain-containing protein [Chloroflexota bacterium]
MTAKSALVLEDGSIFWGESFGAPVDGEGEVVFNTSMTGYQEIATDPSYGGQIVTLTYPLIGNYGIAQEHQESRRPWIAGLIVREYYDDPSNWNSHGALAPFLREHGIPALHGVDTRALTRRLRARGTMRAMLVQQVAGIPEDELVARVRQVTPLSEKDLVARATIEAPVDWGNGNSSANGK